MAPLYAAAFVSPTGFTRLRVGARSYVRKPAAQGLAIDAPRADGSERTLRQCKAFAGDVGNVGVDSGGGTDSEGTNGSDGVP